MLENNKDGRIPFKIFLDKSTNLITIFGIFNALFIYSTTIENIDAAEFLLPAFFLLSILVWLELILFLLASNDGSKRYYAFYILICMIEIGMVYYFVYKFSSVLVFVGLLIAWLGSAALLTLLVIKIFSKGLSKLNLKLSESIVYLVLLLAMIVSGLVLKISQPYYKPLTDKYLNPDTISNIDSSKVE